MGIRKMKYRNQKTIYNGKVYDSKKEAKRAWELELMERAGKIRALERQKSFVLQDGFVNNQGEKIRPITYVADFCYWDMDEDCMVVEDVKSAVTKKIEVYRLKKKIFMLKYPDIKFVEWCGKA